ncbi:Kinesin-like protein [Nymphaea thermarum]|nr:Kinesin-like protein [Nymphaea thermarum]
MEAGPLSSVGKAITKNPSKQSKNSPITKNPGKKSKNSHKSGRENVPPSDLNVLPSAAALPSPMETIQDCDPRNEPAISATPDVQVAVRIRPLNDHEESGGRAVRKVSSDSLCIGDKTLVFDSVFDSDATQEDVFHQVGAPLVKNSLAGFNTTLLLYGQEKENCGDKQLSYQCRCSFLEFKEDVKNGVYVENLTEDSVMNMDDVNNILIKGLSNRRVGATSMHSKSSRSHIILTCFIESWCKVCFKFCRKIPLHNLVVEIYKLCHTESSKECSTWVDTTWVRNVVKIVADGSQSGNSQHIPYRCSSLTYLLRDSIGGNTKLTVLCTVSPAQRNCADTSSTLRFGQRARAIHNKATVNEITEDDEELIRVKSSTNSYDGNSCKNLRAWNTRKSLNRLRLSLNHSIMLSQIDAFQDEEEAPEGNLPEENLAEFFNHLQKLCSSSEENLYDTVSSSDQTGNRFFASKDSFADGMKLKRMIDSDTDLRKLKVQPSCPAQSCTNQTINNYIHEGNDCSNKDLSYNIEESVEIAGVPDLFITQKEDITKAVEKLAPHKVFDICGSNTMLQVSPCKPSSILQEPTESTSPRITDHKQKGLTSPSLLSHNYCSTETASPRPKVPKVYESHSKLETCGLSASSRSSKKVLSPTEHLAASLQRGMQIFDNHRRDSSPRKPSSFSFVDLSQKPFEETNRVNAEVQTSSNSTRTPILFMCIGCKKVNKVTLEPQKCVDFENGSSSKVTINSCEMEASESQVIGPLANALDKENLMADASSDQAAINKQLNLLVQQYEQECAQNLQLINSQKDEIVRLEGLLNANLISNEVSEARRCHPLAEHECQNLNGYHNGNDQLVRKANSDLEKLKMEFDSKYIASCGLTEKEALLREIEDLRNQLQSYMEGRKTSLKETPSLLQSAHLRKSICVEPTTDASSTKDDTFELERQRWMEAESQWILLTEGLRVDMESSRSLAERKELELNLEKKCSNELNDALQRAIQGHARIIEQYADLQDNYIALLSRHRKIMEGIEEMKRVASKAGKRGAGSILAESLAAELSVLRFEKGREKYHLKKENRRLNIQLKDTAEVVQAAGELLVRLKQAEAAAINAEERCENFKEEVEHMKHKMEKLEKKHVKELDLLKAHLANSRLPESALEPLFQQQADSSSILHGQHEGWGQDFAPYYQERGGIFSSTSNQMLSQSNTRNTIWEKWNESAA